MKPLAALALAIVVVVPSAGTTAFSAPPKMKLSEIFRFDMLNARVVYIESLIGPAIRIGKTSFGQYREYKIAGCNVVAYADFLGETINAYSLSLGPQCSFYIDDMIGQSHLSTRGLSIGKFVAVERSELSKATADCLALCGNERDPSVSFTFRGPHAWNYVFIELTVSLTTTLAINASQKWSQAMKVAEGSDYVETELKFNCSSKYDATAFHDFYNIPATTVTVGLGNPPNDSET